MHLLSLLLRVLLGLCLIANGIGAAQASARMHADRAAAAAAMATGDTGNGGGSAGCHDGAPAMDAAPLGHGAMADSFTSDQRPAASEAGDCCERGACPCACAQPTAAVAVFALVPGALPVRGATPAITALPHTPPRLAHLIRPPIVAA